MNNFNNVDKIQNKEPKTNIYGVPFNTVQTLCWIVEINKAAQLKQFKKGLLSELSNIKFFNTFEVDATHNCIFLTISGFIFSQKNLQTFSSLIYDLILKYEDAEYYWEITTPKITMREISENQIISR